MLTSVVREIFNYSSTFIFNNTVKDLLFYSITWSRNLTYIDSPPTVGLCLWSYCFLLLVHKYPCALFQVRRICLCNCSTYYMYIQQILLWHFTECKFAWKLMHAHQGELILSVLQLLKQVLCVTLICPYLIGFRDLNISVALRMQMLD